MIDQNSQFFAILTAVGEAKQANADALGIPWLITAMAVGDANGTDPLPDRLQTSLIHELRRAPLNQLWVDPANPGVIIAEQVIPEDVGGWWIRELGLYDADGDLVAVANCPPTFKPLLAQGSGRTQVVRMNLIVTSADNIELKIDPSVVLATRAYCDGKVAEELAKLDHKNSVRVTTTAAIALSGLQTIDDVALAEGDRVLVKDQATASENGIFLAAAGAWNRAPDADANLEVTPGMIVPVETGTAHADSIWQLATGGQIILGTTDLVFEEATGPTGVTAGTFRSVTVDKRGRVLGGSNPTTLAGYGITDAAPINSPALTGNPTAPTPSQFDNDVSLATTEFVQRAVGNRRWAAAIVASRAITADDFGGEFLVSAAANSTLTMPATSDVANGASIRLVNLGLGPCMIDRTGADAFIGAFNTSGLAPSFVLAVNDEVSVTRYGNLWLVIGSGSIAGAIGDSGYRFMGGGLIEQWGTVTGPATPANSRWDFDVLFPLAFPTKCLGVVGVAGISTPDLDASDGLGGTYRANKTAWQVSVPLATQFEAAVWYTDVPSNSRHFMWRAWGK